MSSMPTTIESTNGFVEPLQQSNLMVSNTSADGVFQSITAGRPHICIEPVLHLHVTQLDEIALYDRQIRLWGVKAQEK